MDFLNGIFIAHRVLRLNGDNETPEVSIADLSLACIGAMHEAS